MTKEQVLEELHQIAQEMNLPFDNDNILTIWCRRNSGMPQKIADEIFPLYTRKGIECKKVSAIIDNNGNITHIKTEYDNDYKSL